MLQTRSHQRVLALAILAAIIASWTAVALVGWLLEPTLTQWTLLVTFAAVATEAGFWIGATLLGIAAFRNRRRWLAQLFGGGPSRAP